MAIGELRLDDVVYTVPSSDGSRRPLDGVSATFRRGEVVLLTGTNGAGKSTLLHLVACILRPTSGAVLADGEPVSRWRAGHRDRWRRHLGICFQQLHLLDDLTAVENTALPLVPLGLPLRDMETAAFDALAAFGLESTARGPVGRLSGGERQRVALARATVCRPDVLLLDEPTAHLDVPGIGHLAAAIEAARRETVVMVTGHDDRLVRTIDVDRRLTLSDGRLEEILP
jgi:ABC-type lipoprotein export system ATPase subunit